MEPTPSMKGIFYLKVISPKNLVISNAGHSKERSLLMVNVLGFTWRHD